MFEAELFLGGIGLGIVIAIWIWPKLIWPRLKERWINEEHLAKRQIHEYKLCPKCGSKTRHKPNCPNNPENKEKPKQ